ncbi:MAG: TIGR03016 family PEP-CTERM system-associated outer membrane protein [Oxalobacteraceae bacterium]|nr:MAG: TIGR03016 family PEP-CTERM system-associated outer membrane protein [Oxalobacteraceae bacterium]
MPRVQASFGRRYFGKTGLLDANYRTQRTVWSLNYNDAVTTSRQQFLLPAAVDTAAMLDSLFASAYPDAAQRQQAVQAYMAAAGLPATLRDSINYLSNRYIRVRRLQGTAILRGQRSNLAFTLFRDQRNALSTQESDSALLLGQVISLNDDTKQRGASVNYDYRLSTRSNAYASMSTSRVESLTTRYTNNLNETRLGVNHRFDLRSQGSVELRHSRGRADLYNAGTYSENALSANLSVAF